MFENFISDFNKIVEKMEFIGSLPHVNETSGNTYCWIERNFKGLEVFADTVTYHSSTWYSGCGEEEQSFSVSIDELNMTNEELIEKYNKINEENLSKYLERIRIQEVKDAETNIKKEKALYEDLHKKYGK
jgi:hypothetical protein